MAELTPHPAHEVPLNRIKKGLLKSRLSHALILEGSQDIRVQDLALEMAAEIMCHGQNPCEKDPRIFHLTHPNVKVIESTKTAISKDDILALQHDFNQTAIEAGPKIYVIFDAEKMNGYAANALLKFLEEPHANIYGILVTSDALSLLPTILSRSQLISVSSGSNEAIFNQLIASGAPRQASSVAAALWHNIERAQEAIESDEFTHLLDHIPRLLAKDIDGPSILKKMRDYWPELDRDKGAVIQFLDVFMLYLKDLLYAKLKASDKAVFCEVIPSLEKTAEAYDYDALLTIWNETLALKEKCEKPIHLSLALDNWALMIERGDVI